MTEPSSPVLPAPAPAPAAAAEPCPRCGAGLTTDPRFAFWCPTCDWNVGPERPEPTRHERAAAARADRLHRELAAGTSPTARREWLLASAAATLVHLSTAALFLGSLALLVAGNTVQRCLGGVLLVFAVVLRPRFGRVPRGEGVLDREQAPALYGLADRVAAEVGAPRVDLIVLDDDFNASFGVVGLRRRTVLTLGLPLWEALDDQQRIALLGHEFGHRVNGDNRRSFWLGTAISTLATWYDLARPGRLHLGVRTLLVRVGEMIADLLLKALAWLLLQAVQLLDGLTSRAGQQAEYLADSLAARTAGTEAARGLLTTLLLRGSAEVALTRARSGGGRGPRIVRRGVRSAETARTDAPNPDLLWERMREHLASIPAVERDRLLRWNTLDRTAVDGSHPPTHLRLALLGHGPEQPAAVRTGPEEAAAVAAEIAPHRARIAAALLAG
ncbi:M48 family metalloprotease [Kitasatospora sp. NPDC051170]|uniref:M48 family metalloprotease n=1 Tax=Kitasatospora sp. NPDC051170 TaxID=3364056 RepID=UPI0037A83286